MYGAQNRDAQNRDDGGAVGEPPDLSGRYNTVLSPQDEAAYQAWGKQQAAQRDGRNPAGDTYDYDMRGFWHSGEPLASNGHAGDTYKKPNHPTFSNQSKYSGADGQAGGAWYGGQGAPWGFAPSATNLKSLGAAGLERYFQQREPGNYLMLPQDHATGGSVRREDGGAIGEPAASLPVQSLATQSPMQQTQLGNFEGMSIEQLQETALRLRGTPQGQLAQRVLAQKRITGEPAAAPQSATTSGGAPNPAGPPQGFALGGTLNPAGGMNISERGIGGGASPAGGFLHTAGPGRSDNLHIHPHADSYVMPADVISGSGEGNSLAGAKAFEMALHAGPGGIALPAAPGRHHYGAPKAPGGFGHGPHAAGGAVDRRAKVPIVAAGGEQVLTPEQVAAIGHHYGGHANGGNVNHGHAILDKLVLLLRARTIKDLKGLKGPVKT